MNVEEKVLKRAREVFVVKGIRSATMDELAQSLGMSKRTIYEHFPDKKALVQEEAIRFVAFMKEKTGNIIAEADNVIQGVTHIMTYVREMLKSISPLYFSDMKRYYPEAYALISKKKSIRRGDVTLLLLHRGVEEGIFRKDINFSLVAHFFTMVVLNDHQAMEGVDDLKHGDFERDVLFAYMEGIATDKGRKLIQLEKEDYFKQMPQYGVKLPICNF